MSKRDLTILLVALIAIGGTWFSTTRASARAIAENARADSVATVLTVERERALEVLATHDSLTAVVAQLEQRSAVIDTVVIAARANVPDVSPETPATDTVWKARSLAQDTVIAAQEEAIVVRDGMVRALRVNVASLSSELLRATDKLFDASAELERQSRRTEVTPRKIFGLIPLPVITLGYGATVADGRVQTGPQLNVGWKVAL